MMCPPPLAANEIMDWANEALKDKNWKQTSRKFKINLVGWKYYKRVFEADSESKKRADEWFGEINVVLVRVKDVGKIGSLGSFCNNTATMKVKICKGMLFEIVVLHELIHWSQSYLELIAGYVPDAKKRTDFFFTVGYPSKKIRDYYIVPQKKKSDAYRKVWESKGISTDEELHFLNDIEFYPNLYLLCMKFSFICHELKLKNGEMVEAFKVFTALKPYGCLDIKMKKKFGLKLVNSSKAFNILKKFSKGKWKKYVCEIWKECIK